MDFGKDAKFAKKKKKKTWHWNIYIYVHKIWKLKVSVLKWYHSCGPIARKLIEPFFRSTLQQISMEKSTVLCPLIRSNFGSVSFFCIQNECACRLDQQEPACDLVSWHEISYREFWVDLNVILCFDFCLFHIDIARLSSKWFFLHLNHFLDVILNTF